MLAGISRLPSAGQQAPVLSAQERPDESRKEVRLRLVVQLLLQRNRSQYEPEVLPQAVPYNRGPRRRGRTSGPGTGSKGLGG